MPGPLPTGGRIAVGPHSRARRKSPPQVPAQDVGGGDRRRSSDPREGLHAEPAWPCLTPGWELGQGFVSLYPRQDGEFFASGGALPSINNAKGIKALKTMVPKIIGFLGTTQQPGQVMYAVAATVSVILPLLVLGAVQPAQDRGRSGRRGRQGLRLADASGPRGQGRQDRHSLAVPVCEQVFNVGGPWTPLSAPWNQLPGQA